MEKNELKISVLVAAYNVEKYIEKCVRSIMSQSYRNIEIIVVNDCSKDSTGEIIENLAQEDKRIICIHHDANRRLPGARNTGLNFATGDYIVFVDGDDWLAEDCIDYFHKLISVRDADMAISTSCFTTRDAIQTYKESVTEWSPEEATANFLYSKITIGAWNKIYKKSFLEQHGLRFKELFTAEGFRFISDCSQRSNKNIIVGNRRVYHYRLNNPGSATTLPDIRQGLGAGEALDGIEKDLILKTPEIMISIRHHRLLNKFYTLRIIIENDSDGENKAIYDECVKYIKENGYSVAKECKEAKIFIRSLFPVLFCKRDIRKKNQAFKMDFEKEKE